MLTAAAAGAVIDPELPALLNGDYDGDTYADFARLTPEALMAAHPQLQLQLGGYVVQTVWFTLRRRQRAGAATVYTLLFKYKCVFY